MKLPANIRVNVKAPFPTLVYGTGPITVTKANGIWTIGFNISQIAAETPAQPAYPTDYVLCYDAVNKVSFVMSFSTLVALLPARPQRSITASGNLPIAITDSILNINAATDLTPAVPLASTRVGSPLKFKNKTGSHLQTLTATAPDTFDGNATYPLGAGAEVELRPYNDGVNAGYSIE